MAATKRKTTEDAEVVEKLLNGHYDRMLADFDRQMDEAAAALRRCHAAMAAENTLRS